MKQPDPSPDVRDTWLEVGGIQHGIRRIFVPPGNGRPVLVFLHDALGSIPQWKDFPSHLSLTLGLNAVLIERQGHGRSDPLSGQRQKDYLHRQAYEVLPEILTRLEVDQPILVGHSDGGTIALLYGARFAPVAIISIAAHIFVEDITVSSVKKALPWQVEWTRKLAKYHGEKTEMLFNAWANTWTSADFRDFNIREEIRSISAPTLVIQSKDDEYGSELQLSGILEAIQSETKEVHLLEEGGHMLHLSQPEILAIRMVDFLHTYVLKDRAPA